MDKNDVIRRLREKQIKWDIIAYCLRLTVPAAKMRLKRLDDIAELGEKPVIKNLNLRLLFC